MRKKTIPSAPWEEGKRETTTERRKRRIGTLQVCWGERRGGRKKVT